MTTHTSTPASLFDFQGHEVRVVTLNGSPWFVAADVCRVLGLANVTVAIKICEPAEVTLCTVKGQRGMSVNLIAESGLYKLVMHSRRVEALPFRNWVAQDVLPAIRKDGMYIMGEEKVATGEMSMDDMILKGMTYLKDKLSRIEKELDEAVVKLAEAEEEL